MQLNGEINTPFWQDRLVNACLGTVHYLYPGGGEILMSYTKILKPPPLDDLNVEDPPPIKY
jgi:hypothetical protein